MRRVGHASDGHLFDFAFGDLRRRIGELANASAQITEGEIKQMTIAGMPDTPQDAYFDVITGKTAILFAAAAAAGAKLAGANDDDVAVMHDYGLQLGLAFQLMSWNASPSCSP